MKRHLNRVDDSYNSGTWCGEVSAWRYDLVESANCRRCLESVIEFAKRVVLRMAELQRDEDEQQAKEKAETLSSPDLCSCGKPLSKL